MYRRHLVNLIIGAAIVLVLSLIRWAAQQFTT